MFVIGVLELDQRTANTLILKTTRTAWFVKKDSFMMNRLIHVLLVHQNLRDVISVTKMPLNVNSVFLDLT